LFPCKEEAGVITGTVTTITPFICETGNFLPFSITMGVQLIYALRTSAL